MSDLDIRDFFDAYDRGDPYMRAAVSELHCKIKYCAPELLTNEADWYKTWVLGGKRNLTTGDRHD
jgi:hypothetical protein